MPEEVVGSRVLVQPAKQVSDGVNEVLLPGRRRIEEHVLRQFEQGPALGVGHPFKHLELHPVQGAGLRGHQQGVGGVEEIV